jgi:hypothetical protein
MSKPSTFRKYVPPAVSVRPAIVEACVPSTVASQLFARPSSSSISMTVVPSAA